jgi:hypothetical protein
MPGPASTDALNRASRLSYGEAVAAVVGLRRGVQEDTVDSEAGLPA